ncbi:cell wall-binding repeat-containing protein [Ornithinimicrobium sp. Arc0846-15]|nr:cell wall-binding repeat-containing protein [Ornithinimicrobium laminariae]
MRKIATAAGLVTALLFGTSSASAAFMDVPDVPAQDAATDEQDRRQSVTLIETSEPASVIAGGDSATTHEHTESEGAHLQGGAAIDAEVAIVGVTWPGAEAGHVLVRSRTGDEWSPWQEGEASTAPVATGGDEPELPGAVEVTTGTEGTIMIGVDEVQFDVVGPSVPVVLDVWEVASRPDDLVDVPRVDGKSADSAEVITPDAVTQAYSVNGPIIGTRQHWGADESIREYSPNYTESGLGVTIHHTAGSNSYSSGQVPAILRGIYDFHAVSRGWGDVGYNILVDKYGRAWEGRRGGANEGLRTAHANGMNYATAGISILGDYTATNVPSAGFEAMAAVTAWRLDVNDLSAQDTFRYENTYEGWTRTLPIVHRHRDVNGTSCPGNYFANRLGEFTDRVAVYQGSDLTAVQKYAGASRYETAGDLAEASHPWGADTVYLASGTAVPDVLSLGPLAAADNDAVLLAKSSSIPSGVQARLDALDPDRVVVVGGTAVVSSGVEQQLANQGYDVSRLSGSDRYATARELTGEFQQVDTLYLAAGLDPADALAGGAAAATGSNPVLLVRGTSDLDEATTLEMARLAPQRIVVLGGTARVSDAFVDQVATAMPTSDVERISGANRFETATLLASDTWPEGADNAIMANGYSPIDAVAGTQLADYQDAPVLLTHSFCQPRVVREAMVDLDINLATVLGGMSHSAGTTRC